jgi:hypothetical protein
VCRSKPTPPEKQKIDEQVLVLVSSVVGTDADAADDDEVLPVLVLVAVAGVAGVVAVVGRHCIDGVDHEWDVVVGGTQMKTGGGVGECSPGIEMLHWEMAGKCAIGVGMISTMVAPNNSIDVMDTMRAMVPFGIVRTPEMMARKDAMRRRTDQLSSTTLRGSHLELGAGFADPLDFVERVNRPRYAAAHFATMIIATPCFAFQTLFHLEEDGKGNSKSIVDIMLCSI